MNCFFNRFKTVLHRSAALLTAVCLIPAAGGCGLIPREEAEHKLNIVTEDASSKYTLAMAEPQDVELKKTIVCTYSQLNELKVFFPISGYRVNSVFVSEGDSIKVGDPLAALDVSRLEEAVANYGEEILEAELDIAQNEETIAFYNEKIASPSVNLLDKEEYTLKAHECEESIISSRKKIDYANDRIAEYNDIISQSVLYSETEGTVYYVKDDLTGWTSSTDTLVMKLLDSGECAFTADDKEACEYVKKGDHVTVERSTGEKYEATVSSADPESGRIVFDLDEPDYSISVGTRASIYLVVDSKKQVLAVPRVAVYGSEDGYYVYVLTDEGIREPVDVQVGLIGNNYVEILGGIDMYTSVIIR
ncbi:MAG: biotin/lipoyl-binding protein [Lachnospiraceae bacterium]|nr:biotin/lipoyl-binding protein [Lachnospiraceae bacterium]